MTRTIIFDMDGTLADSFPLAIDCIKKIAKEEGKDLGIEDFTVLKSKGPFEVIRDDFKIPLIKIPFYVRKTQKMMEKRINSVKLFKDIKTVINKLSKDYKVGILSSNSRKNIVSILENNNLEVDFVHSGKSIFGKDKSLNRVLKLHKLKKNETIYVGDEIRDVKACNKIDLDCIAVTWGFNTKEVLSPQKPTFICDKPKEILKIIKKLD
ncbi:HAD-IA family hydrolase [Candidatus Woesearchaeota archaeon]|nr:HAD-IA family hydrolase [Candidatus Woesearchaeota archaeon]